MYKVIAHYGSHKTYISSMLLLIPAIVCLPLISYLPSGIRWISLLPVLAVIGVAESVVYQAVIIMIAEGAPSGRLGFIQGVASAAAAGMRMIAPGVAGFDMSAL
jgi:MFS family permease